MNPGSATTGAGPEASPSLLSLSPPPPGRLTWWQHLAILGSFVLLVALFTYPLIRDPGHLLPLQGPGQPFHKDPMMYGWTMVSNTRRLLSAPLAVFHGNTFYPHGNVVAHSDLVLTPTLFPAGPVYLLTGNPVLQYNVTLLLWWALSGWAMYVLAFALLRSHAGAAIAAIVFALCPFRTDFFLEFQMQLAFPMPLALLGFLRFLETQRARYLAGALALVWVEALASMYYALILGLCLGVVALLHLILRARAWRAGAVLRLAVGGVALGLALAPFLIPYVQNRLELGLVRGLDQPSHHSADILTYFETGRSKLYRFKPSGHIAETSLFMGFVALALAAGACVLPGETEVPPPPPGVRRARGVLTAAILGTSLALAATLVWRQALRGAGLHFPPPFGLFMAILLLGLARFAVEGWWAARRGERGPLGEREERWIALFLIALFFVLSLGPIIHYGRVPLGRGLYAYLYPYLLPLHAMRITSRLGVVVVLGIALLAAMGMKGIEARLPASSWRAVIPAALALVLLAEYAPLPLPYGRLDWEHPPPVYHALAADPDDVAVLEWPQNLEDDDDYFTFMSINHWKRIVNGASGFSPRQPDMSRDISTVLWTPDRADDPFPTAEARQYLLGIHPLRYVVVHNARLDAAEQQKWQKLGAMPWARLVGRYGSDDLYRLTGEMQGRVLHKYFSWDYARGKTTVAFEARAFGPGAQARWIDIDVNGRRLARQELDSGWTRVVLPLDDRRFYSAPNVIAIRFQYRGADMPGDRPIGRTGTASPVDLFVVSGGKEAGDVASVLVDGNQAARNRRGYNLVAIDAATGKMLWSDAFDTFHSLGESRRLAEAVERLPADTIVAAAVKDEASGLLSDEAVAALRSLGGRQDIRSRFRVSHLLVGVKGAAPGSAIEQVGYDRLEVSLGFPPAEIGVEVREFALR